MNNSFLRNFEIIVEKIDDNLFEEQYNYSKAFKKNKAIFLYV